MGTGFYCLCYFSLLSLPLHKLKKQLALYGSLSLSIMQASNSFHEAFLKHMLMGLKLGGVYSKHMPFQERKRAIKLSADAAVAFTRGPTSWTKGLISDLSKKEKDKALVRNIIENRWKMFVKPSNKHSGNILRSKKILRRSFQACSTIRKCLPSGVIARKVVKKRTQVLKRLIPGCESLNGLSLLGETLDYAIHLQSQVIIMQQLARAFGADIKSHEELQEKEASWVGK